MRGRLVAVLLAGVLLWGVACGGTGMNRAARPELADSLRAGEPASFQGLTLTVGGIEGRERLTDVEVVLEDPFAGSEIVLRAPVGEVRPIGDLNDVAWMLMLRDAVETRRGDVGGREVLHETRELKLRLRQQE